MVILADTTLLPPFYIHSQNARHIFRRGKIKNPTKKKKKKKKEATKKENKVNC